MGGISSVLAIISAGIALINGVTLLRNDIYRSGQSSKRTFYQYLLVICCFVLQIVNIYDSINDTIPGSEARLFFYTPRWMIYISQLYAFARVEFAVRTLMVAGKLTAEQGLERLDDVKCCKTSVDVLSLYSFIALASNSSISMYMFYIQLWSWWYFRSWRTLQLKAFTVNHKMFARIYYGQIGLFLLSFLHSGLWMGLLSSRPQYEYLLSSLIYVVVWPMHIASFYAMGAWIDDFKNFKPEQAHAEWEQFSKPENVPRNELTSIPKSSPTVANVSSKQSAPASIV